LDDTGKKRAVFFDRDGVLNVDHGYVGRIEHFEWTEGARAAIARLNGLGFLVFVVTNQSGVARGYYTEEDVRAVHAHMAAELAGAGAHIDAFHYCPFLPGATVKRFDLDSPLRKPAPGMLLELIAQFDVDRASSFMVGDKSSDMAAARNAGVEGLLFKGGDLDAFVAAHLRGKELIA
jgi:D-glycero-D-manno-heptose 1,7-bisphosphate phosphatase